MFGSWIRRTAFWTLDTIQGGKVKKHYRDIAEKMSGGTIEPSLKEILGYVSENVPYYQGHEYQRLEDFPVINKKEIMANYDAFRSREFPDTDALHEVATSGSSGNPFHAFQNADKRRRVIAELAYIHDSVGWKIGDRYVFLRAWTGHYNSLGFQQFKQNFIPIEVTRFDAEAMNSLRATLKKDRRIEVIIGYSSSLSELAGYMLAQGDSPDMFSIRVIIADSDTLTPEGKRNLEKVFGCPVINRYDNEEQGILAYTKPYTDELTVNAASYYVEVLAMDGDYPAKPGETGRVVVTDMYNKAMAFIRYDTGDLAIAGEMDGTRCLTLKSLQGRTSDVVFATDGTTVYSPTINNYFCDFYDIKKYQLVQKAHGVFELNIVCPEESESVRQIDTNLRRLLGGDIRLTFRFVEDIPAGKNGKFKTVVNEMQT